MSAFLIGLHYDFTYAGLELEQVGRAQSIGLSNDGDQVDACAQLLHDLNVEGLQGVASRTDEIQASVHTKVDLLLTLRLLFLQHVGLVLIVKELDNGLPRIAVVDIVAEARCVNDSQTDCKC